MKRILTATLALAVLAGAGSASAQPHNDQRNNHSQVQKQDNRGPQGYERRATKRYKASAYRAPKGYRAPQSRRGAVLAPAYRTQAYVVDYRRYNLTPPPRGYQYVRTNNDVVLTAIASGVITSVILNMFQ